jgi:hypothetical protein
MNRDVLLRLIAASPLAVLLPKLAPEVEGGADVMPAEVVAPEFSPWFSVRLTGMAPSGAPTSVWTASGKLAEFPSWADEGALASTLRALPSVGERAAQFPWLDRITVTLYRGEEGTSEFHTPLDPARLPVGWTQDLTGFIARIKLAPPGRGL